MSFDAMLSLLAMVPPKPRQEMVALYLRALDELVPQVGEALAAQPASAVAAVHKLAGSAAMMQDRALSDAARAVEAALREGRFVEAASLWCEVPALAQRTRAALVSLRG